MASRRESVFSRLGPVNPVHQSDDCETYKDVVVKPAPLPPQGRNRRQPNGNSDNNSGQPKEPWPTPAAAAQSQTRRGGARSSAKPAVNVLQRTLTDIQRERYGDSMPSLQPSAAPAERAAPVKQEPEPPAERPPPGADAASLQEQLRHLEAERAAAQELADALLASQQALMQEKQRVLQEKSALEHRNEALLEQLEYLQGQGGDSLDEGGFYYSPDRFHDEEPPITPDSGALRQLHLRQVEEERAALEGTDPTAGLEGVVSRLQLADVSD